MGLRGVIAAKRLGVEQIIIMGRHSDRVALARESAPPTSSLSAATGPSSAAVSSPARQPSHHLDSAKRGVRAYRMGRHACAAKAFDMPRVGICPMRATGP